MAEKDKPAADDLDSAPAPTLLQELFEFIVHNKKWWLIPIALVLICIGLLAALASTGAAPFIYTLF